ncbi:MAG TPA: AraC family transcriptional regulator [Candidatus Kapabacteria bacterium]|nr:AraC family transcriptional regulator [Candidatus Kapabacteria bacterium]
MDVVSDVLASMHVRGTVRCGAELAAPWGFSVPATPGVAPFYVIERGGCYLEIRGQHEMVALAGGDIVMITHGAAHSLRDSKRARAVPMEELIEHGACGGIHPVVRHGGDGVVTKIVHGTFTYPRTPMHPLIEAMPPMLHLPANDSCVGPWTETTLRFIASETNRGTPGSALVVSHLTDVLFIQLVRASMARHAASGEDCNSNILRALADPDISRALTAIHREINRAWTVADLAREAGMSRTAFATRFTSLAGMPPLAYATRWRMVKASEFLARGEGTIAEVAERVGYESEAAFSKAFKREMGTAPGTWRRAHAWNP